MCGLAGVLNNAFPVHAGQLASICRMVSFRGPDSSRQQLYDEQLHPAEQGNTAVFFNRLAIIDLDARSNQPFEDERYTLIFNGEIYNYRSLRDEQTLSLTTAGGVAFLTSTADYFIRAYDVSTGEQLWEDRLPAGGQSTPMSYEADGKQYVVTAAGGHGSFGTRRGDYVIAYSLKD